MAKILKGKEIGSSWDALNFLGGSYLKWTKELGPDTTCCMTGGCGIAGFVLAAFFNEVFDLEAVEIIVFAEFEDAVDGCGDRGVVEDGGSRAGLDDALDVAFEGQTTGLRLLG
jgi:hypothetical protein